MPLTVHFSHIFVNLNKTATMPNRIGRVQPGILSPLIIYCCFATVQPPQGDLMGREWVLDCLCVRELVIGCGVSQWVVKCEAVASRPSWTCLMRAGWEEKSEVGFKCYVQPCGANLFWRCQPCARAPVLNSTTPAFPSSASNLLRLLLQAQRNMAVGLC